MLVASTKLTPVYWRFSFTEDCKRGTSILDIRVIISSPDEQAMQAIQPRMAFCCQGHCWLMLSLLPAGVSGLFLQTCSPFRQSQSGKGLGTSFFFLIFFFLCWPIPPSCLWLCPAPPNFLLSAGLLSPHQVISKDVEWHPTTLP